MTATAAPTRRRRRKPTEPEAANNDAPLWRGLLGGRFLPLRDGEVAAVHSAVLDLLGDLGLADAKAFAQLAAAFGGAFAYSQISRVAQQNNIDAAAGMDALCAADLLIAHPCANGERYAFRHELLREAAYHALLRTTRRHYRREIKAVKAQAEAATSSERPAVALSKHRGTHNNSRARVGAHNNPRARIKR